jgi:hypothetical protein
MKDQYLQSFDKRLTSIYRQYKAGITPSDKECHQLEGYMFAAQDISLISREELQDYIDKRHMEILGKTQDERRQEQRARGLPAVKGEFDEYDTPAWIRKGVRVGP